MAETALAKSPCDWTSNSHQRQEGDRHGICGDPRSIANISLTNNRQTHGEESSTPAPLPRGFSRITPTEL
jgi:hypothetical protein